MAVVDRTITGQPDHITRDRIHAVPPESTRRHRRPAAVACVAAVTALVILLCVCGAGGEASKTADGKTILRVQGWSGRVGFHELAEDLGYFDKVQLEWVGDTTSGPQDI